jgi:hypothetical protein
VEYFSNKEATKQTNEQINRHTDRQRGRQTHRQRPIPRFLGIALMEYFSAQFEHIVTINKYNKQTTKNGFHIQRKRTKKEHTEIS